jgi:hypothetical protein
VKVRSTHAWCETVIGLLLIVAVRGISQSRGGSGWALLATVGPVDDQMGDGDASRLGVVGADGGVWLREVVDGRDTQRDGGCATFPFKTSAANKQNSLPVVTGTGFRRVKISIPVPVPTPKPAPNPRVYPYPCRTLSRTNRN